MAPVDIYRFHINSYTPGSKNLENYKKLLGTMGISGLITELKTLERMYEEMYKYNEAESLSKLDAIAERMLCMASFLSTESYNLQWSVECKIMTLLDMGSVIQKKESLKKISESI